MSAITTFGTWADPNLRYLARRYELADRNFQPVIGPTRPNIMMAVNATAHGWHSNRPNPHPTPWYSIFDELTAHRRSWRIYLALPPSYLRGTAWYSLVPPQQALNARQNDLAGAFSYRQRPLPPPHVPVAPHDTIGFHGRHLPSHVRLAHPHGPLRLYLDAQGGGLALDQAMAGRVRLTAAGPRRVKVPAFPVTTRFVAGRAMVKVTFPVTGYYRITASGPHGSLGWVTVVVVKRHQRAVPGTAGLPARACNRPACM